jgi:DNA-binding transcriptional LysR family regulator
VDLRHMRHFVVVAEELHFGRAARRLNMAQPPLSQSIKRLELALGVELLDRTRHNVVLTEAGSVYLEEARRTLTQAELARKIAQRVALNQKDVRVAFIGPALYRVLPDLLVQFRAEHPDTHVRLYERSSPEQFPGMLARDFDVGFVTTFTSRPSGCETLLVERAQIVAAVPADSPLARRSSVKLAQLAEQPFIMPPQRYAAPSLEPLTTFKALGLMPTIAQEATQTNTTLSLVGAGLGCSVVMATAALTRARNVRFVPIRDEITFPVWEMMMAWLPEQMSLSVSAFVKFARRYVKEHPHLTDPDVEIP